MKLFFKFYFKFYFFYNSLWPSSTAVEGLFDIFSLPEQPSLWRWSGSWRTWRSPLPTTPAFNVSFRPPCPRRPCGVWMEKSCSPALRFYWRRRVPSTGWPWDRPPQTGLERWSSPVGRPRAKLSCGCKATESAWCGTPEFLPDKWSWTWTRFLSCFLSFFIFIFVNPGMELWECLEYVAEVRSTRDQKDGLSWRGWRLILLHQCNM